MTEVEKIALCRAMIDQPADADGWGDNVVKSYLTIAGQKI